MKLKIYAVKDTVQGAFMNPFYQHNDMEAQRSFALAIKDERSSYKNIAKDIQLFNLGEFDDETGEINPNLEYISKGLDYIEEKKGE